jgi:protein-S-isoprenylcysteine O-methyltransferase Ste14
VKKISSFIIGLIIFIGLPITGWVPDDITGFIQNPIRLAYIISMIILSVFVVLFVPNEGKGYGEGIKTIKRQKISIALLQIIPPILLVTAPFLDHHRLYVFEENNSIRSVGLIMSVLGFLFMNWSILVLGKQFSVDVTIQENHQLIISGPYKYIRHPRYLGIIIFFGGIPFIFLTWMATLIVLLLIIVLLWRIRDEERLMQEKFKTAWEDYKKRTHALIPFIY